jgi:hypothetical protein
LDDLGLDYWTNPEVSESIQQFNSWVNTQELKSKLITLSPPARFVFCIFEGHSFQIATWTKAFLVTKDCVLRCLLFCLLHHQKYELKFRFRVILLCMFLLYRVRTFLIKLATFLFPVMLRV